MRVRSAFALVHAAMILVVACSPTYTEAEPPTDGGPDAIPSPTPNDASTDSPVDASDAAEANDGSSCTNKAVTLVTGACGGLDGYVDMCRGPSINGKSFFAFDPPKPKSNSAVRIYFSAEIGNGTLHLDVAGAYCAGPASAECEAGTCCPKFRSAVWSIAGLGLSPGTYPIRVLKYPSSFDPTPCNKPDAAQVFDASITLE